jgi:hypothetical protein
MTRGTHLSRMCAGPTTYPHKHGRAHQRARTRASHEPEPAHPAPIACPSSFPPPSSSSSPARKRAAGE